MMSARTVTIAVAVLSLSLIAPTRPARGQPAGAAPQAGAIRAEGLTQQQFDALPDSAAIEHKGVRITKGQLRARAASARAQAEAKRNAARAQRKAKFEANRANFLATQHARLAEKLSKFRAEVVRLQQVRAARMTPQRQALHREAWDLVGRAKNAAPAERPQLDQRAAEILQQLRGSGPPAAGPGHAPMSVR